MIIKKFLTFSLCVHYLYLHLALCTYRDVIVYMCKYIYLCILTWCFSIDYETFYSKQYYNQRNASVSDVPQLTLKLGSKLRHSHIQEGKDVYLECAIIANPSVTDIGWKFEDRELHTNKSAGIIVSNQSLVLQSVKRSNRGKYTCTAENSEGTGESAALYLRVQCK